LVAALRAWLPGSSWSDARKLLRARRVLVNRALSLDEGRRLTEGEIVEIADRPQAPPPRDEDVKIAHLDRDVIVVQKPSGMTTLRHKAERGWPEARRRLQPTLDEVVTRLLANQPGARIGKRRNRPWLKAVHRLDRETSGLLVFARMPEAAEKLIAQFAEHSADRAYQAVVIGHPAAGRIETRLIRDRGDGLRGSATEPNVGKPAVTHLRPLEQLGEFSLIECRLETGRTHQIRIHLSELGYPVCGETKYRHPLGGEPIGDQSGAPRLALHAARLGFTHPGTGERVEFEMPMPRELEKFLERLGSSV
jgi:23S rRNA pseudouridine1911/1915/1917 synthase